MLICQSSSCITHIFIVITYFRILVHVNHLIYYGGDEGNRTPVQNTFNMFFYKLSLSIKISQSITPTNRFYTTVVNIQSRGLDVPLLRSPLVHTSYNPWYYCKMHSRSCLKLFLQLQLSSAENRSTISSSVYFEISVYKATDRLLA